MHERPDAAGDQRARWRAAGLYRQDLLSDDMDAAVASGGDTTISFVTATGEHAWRLSDIDRHARAVALALADRGIRAGDTIAVQLPDGYECVVAYRAAVALGARLVPVPAIYGPREVGFILADSEASCFVTADRWRSIDYLADLPAVLAGSTVELVVVVGGQAVPGRTAWSELPTEPDRELARPDVEPSADVAVIYTSGSTSVPKGVRHSHESLVFELDQGHPSWRTTGARWANVVPLAHMAGFLGFCRAMTRPADTVVLEHWDAAVALDVLRAHGTTSATLPPFHLTTLLEAARAAGVDRLPMRDCLVGSTVVQERLIREADRYGVWGYRCYGSSEHPTISTGGEHDPLDQRAGTDGRVVPDVSVRIVDENDEDQPPGSPGDIISTGPDLFLGYTDPAATAAAFTTEGWFRTGDIGMLDDGVLTITGRRKELIIRGGENLSPKEIEDVLGTHPAVLEVAVVGAPDPRYGERPWAFVVLRDGMAFDLDDVRRHVAAAGLARQKTPEGLTVVDDFPRTAAGKIRKNDLRDRLAAEARSR